MRALTRPVKVDVFCRLRQKNIQNLERTKHKEREQNLLGLQGFSLQKVCADKCSRMQLASLIP